MSRKGKARGTVRQQFLITVLLIFVLQSLMLSFILSSFYNSSVRDIKAMGVSNLKSQATMVENYLGKGGNVLWYAAETVDHMMLEGLDADALLRYLLRATKKMQEQFDENFTGIYGLLGGAYVDGSGWEPPEDYDPVTRDWYLAGMKAHGDMVLSPPYVDAQTGKIIVSYCQLLSDGKSVLALDIVLDEVQNITSGMTMGEMGYGFNIFFGKQN